MGFPRKEITIVTNIYIYRQATKKGEREKKRRNEMCLY